MFPGMNSRQAQQMMKKMGIKQEDIDAEKVIIICKDKRIIIDNPSIQKINMMGQKNYQISGEEYEESLETTPEINEDDIKTVSEQAGVSEKEAKQALEDSDGNIAEAIMNLKQE